MTEYTAEIEKLAGVIVPSNKTKELEEASEELIDVKLDPEHFRKIEELTKSVGTGRGRVEVLQLRMASTTVGINGGAMESKEPEPEPVEKEMPAVSETSKGKKNASKPSKREEELAKKEKNDLSALLSEVTGRSDIVEGSDEDDEEDMPSMITSKKVSFHLVCNFIVLKFVVSTHLEQEK